MRRCEWIKTVAVVAAAMWLLTGCRGLRKLAKHETKVELNLPAKAASVSGQPQIDTTLSVQKIISFRKADGTEAFYAPATTDSLSGQQIMTVAIDEVVISASSRRNLVERNGKINIEFVVTVPEALQDKAWRLVVSPQLQKGTDTLSLEPLVYTGRAFREMQSDGYQSYRTFLDRIVDSADYFDRFGRKAFYKKALREEYDLRQTEADVARHFDALKPREAMFDERVGWMTLQEYHRIEASLRSYLRTTDRKVARMATYTPDKSDKFDHLSDYLAPRYQYGKLNVLPGGEVYTRIDGRYMDDYDCRREAYLSSVAERSSDLRRQVRRADSVALRELAAERIAYTWRMQPEVDGMLRETGDSAIVENYRIRRAMVADRIEWLGDVDTAGLVERSLRPGSVLRNQLLAERSGEEFVRRVRYPYLGNARLDTVIVMSDGRIQYIYNEQITADENTAKLYLALKAEVVDRSGREYVVPKSDTLTYSVASMTNFVDPTPRYVQRIITRDAEASQRFFFNFPLGKSTLVDTLPENRRQIAAVRRLTHRLMTDPVYIIDSITLRATSSPEGSWERNELLAHERAEALRRVVVSEFRKLYDSLEVSASYELDAKGNVVLLKTDDALPDLPNLLHTQWLAEDWNGLQRMVEADVVLSAQDKEGVLALISQDGGPDLREARINTKYPKAYQYISRTLYPHLRAVDFRFSLHRRGMQKDTVYTTELDSNYLHAVGLLKKRRYEEALTTLRAYDDRNAALAYMSLGYDAAAYRILQGDAGGDASSDVQYLLAVLASRLGDEERAVQYFLRSVELSPPLKFRGNLDPEIARLIRKYNLFPNDF